MPYKTINVRAVDDKRIARESPRGEFIPHDRYVTVEETPYIRRLRDVHGDIEQEPAKAPAKATKVAPPPAAEPAEEAPKEK